MKWIYPLAFAFAYVLIGTQAFSGESTLGTLIGKVPTTISKGGVYYLSKDLVSTAVSGTAITITAPSVVVDLNGHEIITTAGLTNTSTGIVCTGNRVTVEDGTVTGFERGVVFNNDNAVIKDLLINQCLRYGIVATGSRIEISHNRVCETGGSTVGGIDDAIGITVNSGTYATILNNDVQGTVTADKINHTAEGIVIENSTHVVASNNRILDTEPAAPIDGGMSTGFLVTSSSNLTLLGNLAETNVLGFNLAGAATGDYGDNITSSPAASYMTTGSNLSDIGNNQ